LPAHFRLLVFQFLSAHLSNSQYRPPTAHWIHSASKVIAQKRQVRQSPIAQFSCVSQLCFQTPNFLTCLLHLRPESRREVTHIINAMIRRDVPGHTVTFTSRLELLVAEASALSNLVF
jgi:hypothetical protein